MLIDTVVEEGTGGFTGTDSHRGLYLRFSNACRCTEEELDQVEPLPETRTFLDWRELLIYERSGWSSMAIRAFVRSALQLRQKLSQWARLVLGGT